MNKLLGGVTDPAPVASGYHERVYTSDFTIAEGPGGEILYDQEAEGMSYGGIPAGAATFARAFHFYGKNQPYGIYIPNQPGPHGMQLALHGYSANHASLVNNPGMQQILGEQRNRVLVVPLGRGPAGWYNEISEKDVLDVMTDVEANYPIDPEQVFAGGYLMGGYGTTVSRRSTPTLRGLHRLGRRALGRRQQGHLDARLLRKPAPGARRDAVLRRRRARERHLLPRDPGAHRRARLRAHPLLPSRGRPLHVCGRRRLPEESDWSAGRTRQTQPAQVTYRIEPFVWNESLGVIHDSAYWVSEIRGRDTGDGDYVDADIITSAAGRFPPTSARVPIPPGPTPSRGPRRSIS